MLDQTKTITFTTKLGKTRAGERTRIWIEGKRLSGAGFVKGTRFLKTWFPQGRLELIIAPEDANRANCGTVSGKGEHPIIDITGAAVGAVFGAVSHVNVTYEGGRITITA